MLKAAADDTRAVAIRSFMVGFEEFDKSKHAAGVGAANACSVLHQFSAHPVEA